LTKVTSCGCRVALSSLDGIVTSADKDSALIFGIRRQASKSRLDKGIGTSTSGRITLGDLAVSDGIISADNSSRDTRSVEADISGARIAISAVQLIVGSTSAGTIGQALIVLSALVVIIALGD